MMKAQAGLLSLLVFSLLPAGVANAWSCVQPGGLIIENNEGSPTKEEVLDLSRFRSAPCAHLGGDLFKSQG
ncbi:hypothetical protein, partial [Parasedimentitalea psychrophila]|uniref:hypothetical protein n=1 Tax=Parasedimentitalea psychrophila TaxID=2997337 RepID=UPI0022EB063A